MWRLEDLLRATLRLAAACEEPEAPSHEQSEQNDPWDPGDPPESPVPRHGSVVGGGEAEVQAGAEGVAEGIFGPGLAQP